MGYAKLIKDYSPKIIKLSSTSAYDQLSPFDKTSDITYIVGDGSHKPHIWQHNYDLTGAIYQGASSTSEGVPGLVPGASAGQRNSFLRGDGTWASASYSTVTASANGLVPKLPTTNTNTAFLRADGTWAVPVDTTYSSLKNPNALTIVGYNGSSSSSSVVYDGSSTKSITIVGTNAITNISRSNKTFTATRADGTTFTFDQQDTTYNDVGTSGSSGLMTTGDKVILNNLNSENNNGQATRSSHSVIKNFDFYNSGSKGSTFYVWKKGNIATLVVDFTSANSSSISLTWQNLNDYSGYTTQQDGHLMAQLPNGFYPKKRIAANLTPNHLASTETDFPQITLTTNGGVYLCTYTGTMKGGRAVITYIC